MQGFGKIGIVLMLSMGVIHVAPAEALTFSKDTDVATFCSRVESQLAARRDWNALCNLALAAIDRDTAKLALEKIGGNCDPAVWKERKYFDEAVSWTMGTRE
jgi:hypothetical protein